MKSLASFSGFFACCLSLFFSAPTAHAGENAAGLDIDPRLGRQYVVVKTATPPAIDGELNDECWKKANVLNDFVTCSNGTAPANAKTEVRACYDDKNLYVSFKLEEPLIDAPGVKRNKKNRDEDAWDDDHAGIFMALDHSEEVPENYRGYYQFSINMLNCLQDAKDGDVKWNAACETAAKEYRADKYWTVEIKIPLADIRGGEPVEGESWMVNFGRERNAFGDHDSWARIQGSFHQAGAFNRIVFGGADDKTAPSAPTEFKAKPGKYYGEAVLEWKAPGDDGDTGRAYFYDVRYAAAPIKTEDDFKAAVKARGEPAPLAAGTAQSYSINSLKPGVDCYFAIRAADEAFNAGTLAATAEACRAGEGEISPAVLRVDPTLECCGLVYSLNNGGSAETVKAYYRKKGTEAWLEAHPFLKYDGGHCATSLFNLETGAEYELKLNVEGTDMLRTFSTLPEYVIPAPVKVIEVKPGESIQAAVDQAEPGTEIRIQPGTYKETVLIKKSGTAEHPIVLRGMVPEGEAAKKPWETGDNPIIDALGNYDGLKVQGSSQTQPALHVVIDHLQVRNAKGVGIHLEYAGYCVVQYCQCYNNGNLNLHVNKGGPFGGHHLLQFNYVAERQDIPGKTEDDSYYGIKQDNYVGPATIIRGNLVEGHKGDGIQPSGDECDGPSVSQEEEDVLARFFNHSTDVYDNVVRYQGDDSIEADGVAVNERVFRNRFESSINAISVSPVLPGPFYFIRNTCVLVPAKAVKRCESVVKLNTSDGRGLIRNCYFYHNTFVRLEDEAQIMTNWTGTPSRNMVFRNNLFAGTKTFISFQGLAHKLDMDYDLWYTPSVETEAAKCREMFKSGGVEWESHGVFADPKLHDRTLISDYSPAIDKGVIIAGVNADFKGAAPDLGAVEVK